MAGKRKDMTARINRADRGMQAAVNGNSLQTDDALSVMAPLLRVQPVLDVLCRFGGEWTSPHGAAKQGWAEFHIVTRGECQIERSGEPPILLETGDVLLLPWGDPHIVRARQGRSRHPA